jgi:hypothetical protein
MPTVKPETTAIRPPNGTKDGTWHVIECQGVDPARLVKRKVLWEDGAWLVPGKRLFLLYSPARLAELGCRYVEQAL